MASDEPTTGQRRFRAVDVLTGTIDRAEAPRRARKQISAYLYPEQVRRLGELHARLNSTADGRIEKSEIVGAALDLLGALVEAAEVEDTPLTTLDAVRAYADDRLRKGKQSGTQVREYSDRREGECNDTSRDRHPWTDRAGQSRRPRGQRGRRLKKRDLEWKREQPTQPGVQKSGSGVQCRRRGVARQARGTPIHSFMRLTDDSRARF